MQIYKDGQVAHYKTIFSNVSFPASGPSDAFLAERGAYKVSTVQRSRQGYAEASAV
jgi:hypothetical protein